MEIVVVLGASNKEDRYSYKAVKLLLEYGHEVVPIHPKLDKVLGLPVLSGVIEISSK